MKEADWMARRIEEATWSPVVPDSEQWGREIRFAARVQRSLLEAEPITGKGFVASGRSIPRFAVGGDYFDFVPLPGGGVRAVVADVMGKGFGAAMLMTMVRSAVRAISPCCATPGHMFQALNDMLYTDLQRLESFVAMACVDLLPDGNSVRLSAAGAPPPLLVGPSQPEAERIRVKGVSLGLLPGREYQNLELTLKPGDMLVLYTDGITEVRDSTGRELGWAGLGRFLLEHPSRPLPDLLNRVLDGVASYGGVDGVRDDVTMVVIRFTPEGGEEDGTDGSSGFGGA